MKNAPEALREWLDAHDITAAAFAEDLEIWPETLSRYMKGRLSPSKITRLAIEHITDGHVQAGAWEGPP